MQGNKQARLQTSRGWMDEDNTIPVILAGVVGNIVGVYGGVTLGNCFPSRGESLVPPGAILGGGVGSVFGSALGVYLAGNSHNAGGNFGSALKGSFLGELAAIAVSLAFGAIHDVGVVPLLSFAILPPVGAALLFNRSLNSGSFQTGTGFLNLAEGKLGLGVPDIQVQPLFVPGLSAKPELQFNVKVLSVTL